jgi:exopolysaccharide biosynthesis WecB/TagA/CpsF family protein
MTKKETTMQQINLLGLDFDDLDVADVLALLLGRRRQDRFAYIVTPNADHFARLRRIPQLRSVYEAAWLRLLDSQMICNAAQGLGLRTPHVATGADITDALLEALPPQPVALVGLEACHLPALRARYPHLTFLHHDPPRGLMENLPAFRRARDFVLESNAGYVFFALGSPVQELLAYTVALRPESTGTGLCVGAALEYRAGAAIRAPVWMREAGLEWLHRLAHNPRRLARRYLLDDPPVFFDLLTERLSRTTPRFARDQPPPAAPDAISAPGPYPPPRRARLHEIRDAR